MLINGSETSTLISEIVGRLRNKQTNPADFRISLKRIGNYLAYESAMFLETVVLPVETPFGTSNFRKIKKNTVIITILRAALPMSEGVLEVLPEAKVGVISASRGKQLKEDGRDFRIDCTYTSIPYLEDKIAIVVDPILASGSTLLFTLQQIKEQKPLKIIILCAIASRFGTERLLKEFPEVIIIAGAIDEELNEKGYIVPGLGDAGDRAFNT
ncbi:MAG: uracil phosphoribosyltransferase [Candidatus Heimdallarchaeota archaeon]|nr:uracil phosphoribosyltransferase [Candidatus Heimdallarchaeota archaeon]